MTSNHTTISTSPPSIYPPIIDPNVIVDPHDRPYAEYGHLGNLV